MRRIWDITLPLEPGTPVWPGDPPVEFLPASQIRRGDSCNVTAYRFGSHSGTHVDPPLHFFDDGAPLYEIPLERFLGLCFVADLTLVRETIRGADLERAGIPASTERLLLKTTNSSLWSNPRHEFVEDFVDLSPDGADWVLSRGIRLVGIDYLSIEGPKNPDCPVHKRLLAAGALIAEGLDLREIEPGEYDLLCLPLKAMNGDGAPARICLIREERFDSP